MAKAEGWTQAAGVMTRPAWYVIELVLMMPVAEGWRWRRASGKRLMKPGRGDQWLIEAAVMVMILTIRVGDGVTLMTWLLNDPNWCGRDWLIEQLLKLAARWRRDLARVVTLTLCDDDDDVMLTVIIDVIDPVALHYWLLVLVWRIDWRDWRGDDVSAACIIGCTRWPTGWRLVKPTTTANGVAEVLAWRHVDDEGSGDICENRWPSDWRDVTVTWLIEQRWLVWPTWLIVVLTTSGDNEQLVVTWRYDDDDDRWWNNSSNQLLTSHYIDVVATTVVVWWRDEMTCIGMYGNWLLVLVLVL